MRRAAKRLALPRFPYIPLHVLPSSDESERILAPVTSKQALAQITSHIQSNLYEWFGEGARLHSSPELRRRKWSFFIRYEVERPEGGAKGLLVKVPRLAEMTTLAEAVAAKDLVPFTQIEFEALVRLARFLEQQGTQPFRAVQPIAFLPQWNAFAMEELPLQPLKTRLKRPGLLLGRAQEWQSVVDILRTAGSWLKIFHEQVGLEQVEQLHDQNTAQEIRKVVQELKQVTRHTLDVKPIERSLTRQLEKVRSILVPVANLHTDMSWANIFSTPDGGVGVLDAGGHVRAPVYADLAVVITDPHTRFWQVLTRGRALRRDELGRCANALLEGYFGASPFDENLLNLYCALAIVRKWAQDEEALNQATKLTRLGMPLLRWYMRKHLQSELQRYLPEARVDDLVAPAEIQTIEHSS